MPEFDKELKQQVLDRDNWTCQKCGSKENLQVSHIKHRKMGGDSSKNEPDNLITLCYPCHDEFDSEEWHIEKWEPDNKEDGLQIIQAYGEKRDDGTGLTNVVPHDDLYFYQFPTKQVIHEAKKVDKNVKEALEVKKNATKATVAHLQEMKDRTVDGMPLYKGIPKASAADDETYNSFKEYVQSEILPKSTWGSSKTAYNLVSAQRALKPANNDIVGIYLAFERDELEQSVSLGTEIEGKTTNTHAKVDEQIDRDNFIILKVIEPDNWREFHTDEQIVFENGMEAKLHQVGSELNEIDLGNYGDLASIVRNQDLNRKKKKELVEAAKGPQKDFKKQKRDLLTLEDEDATRTVSAKQCTQAQPPPYTEFEHEGKTIKLGDWATWCPKHSMIIETMSSQQSRKICEEKDDEYNCFEPKD